MRFFRWRIGNFLNVHFHKLYMLAKYRTTDLNTREYWDGRFLAKNYKESESTADIFPEIKRMITPGASVLDVGVGTGQLLKQIRAAKTSDVCGLDISGVAIARLKEAGIEGFCCRLPAMPPVDRQFDFVIAKALLEHLKHPRKSLRTLERLLRDDGTLIISVPNEILGPQEEPEHLRKYSEAGLREELSEAFDVVRIDVMGICLLAVCTKRHQAADL
jgi:2-polyprenyl-3-methyl-5-hydroxy-6-metoxy-1,4-benzoquinol methylase